MTLPAPSLDDRTFQDIVDEAKRLIPIYCPEWTNHNLSDPGVALIELFAWMTELMLYRINQVPDRLYTHFLDLIGVELFPASAASADVTFWLSAPTDEVVIVPAGTLVSTNQADPDDAVVFATDAPLELRQPELIAFLTGTGSGRYTDRWPDLEYGKAPVRCFASRPIKVDNAFYLGFSRSLSGHTVRLDVTAKTEGLGIDPLDPPLRWEAWTGEEWVPTRVHADDTGGLNTNGSITLRVPFGHRELTVGQTKAHWIRGRLLEARPGQRWYRTSPAIASITAETLGGTVSATHGQPVETESLGRSDGTPAQVFRTRLAPVLPRREGEHVLVLTGDGVSEWHEVGDFSRSEADDQHVVWSPTSGEIRFGPRIAAADGATTQYGAVPPSGAEIIVSRYRHGGGRAGNVGAGTLTVLRTTIPYIDRVENVEPAAGGVDAETVENAKQRGPATLRHAQRAVTADDFEQLTLDADRMVARARCLSPQTAGEPIRLLIVPRIDARPADVELDDFVLPPRLVANVVDHLEPRRLLGSTVTVGAPYYQGVSVVARVEKVDGRPAGAVRQRVLDALYQFVHPLVGGPRGQGWPFERDVHAADLERVVRAVDGVKRVEEVLLFEADLRNKVRVGDARTTLFVEPDSLVLSFRHQVVVE